MQGRKIFIGLVVTLSLLCAQTLAAKPKGAKKAARQVTFKVRIENISSPEGQAASDGTRWPFALSPGLYVLDEKGVALFREGCKADAGLESQAEDVNLSPAPPVSDPRRSWARCRRSRRSSA